MKTLLATLALIIASGFSFGQIQFGEIYATAPEENGELHYLRIYEDGLVLMIVTNTKDDITKVEQYFNREFEGNSEVEVSKSQSKIKEGAKASFVLENDGNNINCIAQGYGVMLELTMLSPSMGKQEMTFMRVEPVDH